MALANTGATTVDAQCNWWGQPNPSPVANGLATGPATVTPWLQDSDLNSNCIPILTIGVFPAKVAEGNSGITPLTFAAILDRPSSVPVTVQWDTVNGTGRRRKRLHRRLERAGHLRPWSSPEVHHRRRPRRHDPEPKEKFTVHLHGTSHAVLANNTKHMTILNDD